MDTDLLTCTDGEPASDSAGPVVVPPPGRHRSGWYSPEAFAGAVGAALAPHDIAVRLDESWDGTRLLTAWRAGIPAPWHVIPIDTIGLGPDEVAAVAAVIHRSLALAITD